MTRSIFSAFVVLALTVAPAALATPKPLSGGGGQTATQKPTTAKPAQPPAKPAAPTTKPAAPTSKPAAPTSKPAAPTTKPAATTTKPVAPATPAVPLASAKQYGPGVYAHFTTTHGNFIVRFFDKDAPLTVQNFVGLAEGKKQWTDPRTNRLVRRPYYNNLIFHRIIPGFMIQGGDPEGTGTGGPGFKFNDEISPKLKHDRPGIVSMANAGPNTNGGQFFITVAPYPSLDGHYSVFGEVVEGLDNVIAISKVPTTGPRGNPQNRPLKPVIMKSVRIERVS
jgi:peptidyl-prolyl cis-trans isomerase A (cyclophilin A)